MASLTITTRQTRSGARYVVRYRLGGRAYPLVHGGSFRILKEARARRDLIAGEIAAGRNPAEVLVAIAVTPPVPRTFGSFAQAWVASRHDVTAKQRADYRHPLRLMIGPDALVDFGPRDPATITAAEVREFVGKLADRYAPSTVRTYFTPLAQILDFAELPQNPARHASVKLPGRQQEEPTPITLAELRALLACMPRKYVLPMRLLEATALRVGELVKLEWGDVDLRSSRLRVSRARTKGRTSGQRFAQIPPPLMDELQELLPFEDRSPERSIFIGLSESSVKAAMWRGCKQAGITAYHPHDLRHRRLSLWHGQGVPARVLAERAGHAHASMSLDVYSHVIDPGDDEWLG